MWCLNDTKISSLFVQNHTSVIIQTQLTRIAKSARVTLRVAPNERLTITVPDHDGVIQTYGDNLLGIGTETDLLDAA